MNRNLETRVAKLETKRGIEDDDLARLTDEELERRIEEIRAALVESYGGLRPAIEALRSDPTMVSTVAVLEQRLAEGVPA